MLNHSSQAQAHQSLLDFKLQQEIAFMEHWLNKRKQSRVQLSPSLLSTFEGLINTRKRLLNSL